MKKIVIGSVLALMTSGTFAQTPDSSTPADNSKTNKPPMNSTVKTSTADGQGNATSDIKMTQQIRKSVMADKKLSTYGHNVKIVTVNGAVTLNGTVRSADEKSNIEMKAKAVAGDGQVTNDLKVAP
jgi:hyperosmotically inducible protein